MVLCFPRTSRLSHLPFIVPSVAATCFWLVVVCKKVQSAAIYGQGPAHLSIFLSLASIRRPKQWDNVPHLFRPGRVSSLTPPSPLTTTFVWLLCPHIKWRPSKAKGPPISLFFVDYFDLPNDGQPSSPHVPTQPHLFSNAPFNFVTVFHLIVV
jgi:hypothetical protein